MRHGQQLPHRHSLHDALERLKIRFRLAAATLPLLVNPTNLSRLAALRRTMDFTRGVPSQLDVVWTCPEPGASCGIQKVIAISRYNSKALMSAS